MNIIKRINVYSHCHDLEGKVWNPAIRWTRKYAVFIVLEDEHGTQGVGECWCFDSAPDALVGFLRTEVIPHYIGQSFVQCESVSSQLMLRATLSARHGILSSSLSGINIALWDLRSRQADLPLFRYINQDANPVINLYASGGLYAKDKTVSDLVAEMMSFIDDGFSIVKMKVGALSLAQDTERVLAVINAIPSSAKVIIDGVYSYTHQEALDLFNVLPAAKIEAFQSPVAAAEIEAMVAMSSSEIPVMMSEAEYRQEIHEIIINRHAVKYLQCSPIACGGFDYLQWLVSLIAGPEHKMSLEVSSTAIAMMAACHFAAANDVVEHVEWHSVHTVFYDDLSLVHTGDRTGNFKLSERPGLGIDLHMDRLTLETEII